MVAADDCLGARRDFMVIDGHDSVQRRDESVNPSLIDYFVPTSNLSGHRLAKAE